MSSNASLRHCHTPSWLETVVKDEMEPTDVQLVQRCQQELPYVTTAFEVLLQRYEPVVFRTCRRYLGHQQEAEEASQDALLRVFHALPRFERRAQFRTWLFRIVMNVCATRFARMRKRAADHRQFLDQAAAELPTRYQLKAEDFEEVTGVIGEGLDMLSPDDRQVLTLRHVSQLSFEELAATLELGLSAAKMRLYRAERRLKAAYERAANKSEK